MPKFKKYLTFKKSGGTFYNSFNLCTKLSNASVQSFTWKKIPTTPFKNIQYKREKQEIDNKNSEIKCKGLNNKANLLNFKPVGLLAFY